MKQNAKNAANKFLHAHDPASKTYVRYVFFLIKNSQNCNILTHYYNLNLKLFSIMYFKMEFIPLVAELNFHQKSF